VDVDTLLDRRRLSRRLRWWRAFAIVAVAAAVIVGIGRFTGWAERDYIARLSVDGLIVDDPARRAALKRIAADDRARALILTIESPGGTFVGGESLFNAIRRVAANKPVVAVMGQVAASAGYMIAVASDRILAYRGTITGSIGVVLQTTEFTGLMEKIGVTAEAIKSSPLKASPNPLERMTPEVREVTRQLVRDMYDVFVSMVAERRGMDKARVLRLADGRVYTGLRALEAGLIDEIGGEEAAIKWLVGERKLPRGLPVRDLHIQRDELSWLDMFTSLSQKLFVFERLTLDGLVSVWQPALR
jgi:protease IV